MELKIGDLIEENNDLVKEIDGMDYENDPKLYSKYIRYTELQNMIKLNKRAEKNKDIASIRNFITSNKENILKSFDNECEVCNFDFKEILIVHHKIPVAKGGTNELSNLSVLCPTCHSMVHHIIRTVEKSEGWKDFEYIDTWVNRNIPQMQFEKLMDISNVYWEAN